MGPKRSPKEYILVFKLKRHSFLISIVTLIVVCILSEASASRGDRDYTFHNCMGECESYDCSGSEYFRQPLHLKILGWNCKEECRYKCMWRTVEIFEQSNVEVPQFFGKWPFIRFLGMQEPASVLASILNLVAHSHGLIKFRKAVSSQAPLFWFWHLFAAVCINGWIWSTIFHTKDTVFTELMDYFCAFSMIVFSFFAAFVRVFERVNRIEVLTIGGAVAALYAYHVNYLSRGSFDYGYNMKANITIGIFNAAVWLIWSGMNRKTHPHAWKCAASIILAVASIVLEVNDFSPIFWTLDAHALWHFATAAISPLWYKFLIDDCQFLAMAKKDV